jgi:hypothetical protein
MQAGAADEDDELFDKLDQLLSRHQGRAQPNVPAPVPTLTEAVESPPPDATQEVPVLHDAVELPASEAAAESPSAERRRQLQVALYLRLRQRLDREFETLLRTRSGAAAAERGALLQTLQALRNALPAIVRESVDQALGGSPRPD